MKSKFLFLIILLISSSCVKETQYANVEYYITVKGADIFESLEFDFFYAAAHQIGIEGNSATRTVYLNTQKLYIESLDFNSKIPIGTSEIEPSKVNGYDVSLGNIYVKINSEPILLKFPVDSDLYPTDINFKPQENCSVTFEIDLDKSIYSGENKELYIKPVVTIIKTGK